MSIRHLFQLIRDKSSDALRRFRIIRPHVKRSSVGAWWDARQIVTAGTIDLAKYLNARLMKYAQRAPQHRRLVQWVSLKPDGFDLALSPDMGDYMASLARSVVTGEMSEEQKRQGLILATPLDALKTGYERRRAKHERLKRELDRLRGRLQDLEAQQTRYMQAAETVPAPMPTVPSLWPIALGYTLLSAVILGEAGQYMVPYADLTGASMRNLWATPMESIMAGSFAMGTAAATVFLPKIGLAKLVETPNPYLSWMRTAAQMAAGLGSLAMFISLAVALGRLRQIGGENIGAVADLLNRSAGAASTGVANLDPWVLPLVNIIVPAAMALYWLYVLDPSLEKRKRAKETLAQWKKAEWSRHTAPLSRISASIRTLKGEESRLEEALETIEHELGALADRIQAVEEALFATQDLHRQFEVAWINDVRAALARDYLAFVKQAGQRRRNDLIQLVAPRHETLNGNPRHQEVLQ